MVTTRKFNKKTSVGVFIKLPLEKVLCDESRLQGFSPHIETTERGACQESDRLLI
jgi:hypothetical protein